MALAAIWGWSFLFIKVAGRGMTPFTVAAARTALGALVVLVWGRARGLRLPRSRREWWPLAVLGVTYSALPFTLLAWGEQRTTSALAAVCNAATPLFTSVAAAALLGERLRPSQRWGLVVGFLGVAVAAGLASRDLRHSSTTGALAAVGAAACYGFGYAYARRRVSGVHPLTVSAGQLIVATAAAAPLAAAGSASSGIHLTSTRVAAIVLLGAFGTGVGFVINYRAIADIGPTRTSLATYLVPVVAICVGVLFLGESFSWRLILGGAVIVGGIALVQLGGAELVPRPGPLHRGRQRRAG